LTDLEGNPVRVIRESPAGLPGFTLIGEKGRFDAVQAILRRHSGGRKLIDVDPESYEVLRIEAGTPVFGKDITDKNLPQELNRDDRAVSFVKGCYLGQETVARIDALGHVNNLLKGLLFAEQAPVPPPGSALEADGKRVGAVTSAAFSPGRSAPVALALLRATHTLADTKVVVVSGEGAAAVPATVSDLPMPARV
jgi:folate-binding protein YgfZ